nr:hypothetical protein [uncultured Flavobacterium sp.]
MIRFLHFSLVLILFASCKSYQPNANFKPLVKTVQNTYFSDSNSEFVYNTKIEALGNTITGLLVIKPVQNNQHRVLLTTEFGNTLLDLTINENSYSKNYAIPDLDRKVILNLLSRDFRIMLTQYWQVNQVANQNTDTIYKSEKNNNNYYLTYKNEQLQTIEFAKSKQKLKISYLDVTQNKVQKIKLTHLDFNIEIELINTDF